MTDNNNILQDPDVQAAASFGGGGGAYADDATGNSGGGGDGGQVDQFISKEQQQDIAVNVVKGAATNTANETRDDYNRSMETQSNVNEKPDVGPPLFCIKLWNWLPLRYFACFGGALLIALPVLDFVLISDLPGIIGIIFLYLIVFGIVVMFIEAPTFRCTRWMQLKMFFWFKFLSRMWGRSWFYIFCSFLCYAGLSEDSAFTVSAFAGFYLSVIALLGFIFSRRAAKVENRIYQFIAAGSEIAEDGGDLLMGRFQRKFDELDSRADGRIGQQEIFELAQQANRTPTNSELQALQTFLDESCNGYVSKEDWMKQWLMHTDKMKFL